VLGGGPITAAYLQIISGLDTGDYSCSISYNLTATEYFQHNDNVACIPLVFIHIHLRVTFNFVTFLFYNTIFGIFGNLAIFVGPGQCFFALILHINTIPKLPKILNMAFYYYYFFTNKILEMVPI
jgi:hypothetical protein